MDDDDDADTLAAFTRILSKVGPEWLKQHLPSTPLAPSSGNDPLTAFLREALGETKATVASLTEKLETMRELLTPEQLIQLKSRVAGPADPRGSPTPPDPTPPDPPPRPKRKFL